MKQYHTEESVRQRVTITTIKRRRSRRVTVKEAIGDTELYDADPNCEHDIVTLWSGVKCRKCTGWYCA